jgi:hypothetical protein
MSGPAAGLPEGGLGAGGERRAAGGAAASRDALLRGLDLLSEETAPGGGGQRSSLRGNWAGHRPSLWDSPPSPTDPPSDVSVGTAAHPSGKHSSERRPWVVSPQGCFDSEEGEEKGEEMEEGGEVTGRPSLGVTELREAWIASAVPPQGGDQALFPASSPSYSVSSPSSCSSPGREEQRGGALPVEEAEELSDAVSSADSDGDFFFGTQAQIEHESSSSPKVHPSLAEVDLDDFDDGGGGGEPSPPARRASAAATFVLPASAPRFSTLPVPPSRPADEPVLSPSTPSKRHKTVSADELAVSAAASDMGSPSVHTTMRSRLMQHGTQRPVWATPELASGETSSAYSSSQIASQRDSYLASFQDVLAGQGSPGGAPAARRRLRDYVGGVRLARRGEFLHGGFADSTVHAFIWVSVFVFLIFPRLS